MSAQKNPDTVLEEPRPAKRVDRRRRDETPAPTEMPCKEPRCVGLHRAIGDYLCPSCLGWHSLPCPAEKTRHR